MKISYLKETFHSDKHGKDFYVVRVALLNEDNEVVKKGEIVLWLDKESFDKLSTK